MIQLYRRNKCIIGYIIHYSTSDVKRCAERKTKMSLITKRLIILAVIIIIAAVLGRMAVRAVLNLLLGGTMFGGNVL